MCFSGSAADGAHNQCFQTAEPKAQAVPHERWRKERVRPN